MRIFLFVLVLFNTLAAHASVPDQVISGSIDGSAHQSYQYIDFEVPNNTQELVIEFEYNRDKRTVIDLGLNDPSGFIGWSGGSKKRIVISRSYASPGYLPTQIRDGKWQLILGVPNIRKASSSEYRIALYYNTDATAFSSVSLNDKANWYRGDLHAHSGHSDGHCPSTQQQKVGCPLSWSVQNAAQKGLDFIAMSEHNTLSQHNELFALQPYFDDVLLMPAREITTFFGHANVFGVTKHLPFTVTDGDVTRLQQQVINNNGILSINHPALPSGEACMGCGWIAKTDYTQVHAIEVVNGSVRKNHQDTFNARTFWHALLNQGYKIAAIAGSDNHNGHSHEQGVGDIGSPTTVIYANSLSTPALLEGIKAGKTFVTTKVNDTRIPKLIARVSLQSFEVGDRVKVTGTDSIELALTLPSSKGEKVVFYSNNDSMALPLESGEATIQLETRNLKWAHAEVYNQNDELLFVTSPIYFRRTS
ncbi:CehA/McbA family metallohydrolase [Pseudoalteromonas sp. T1lg76]|uniref:CehA/McbA family metallohydrolase n=1 Tax=Pseudoalteromonas sp. T1lg76 TaxID=2077103 RepID=UPI000CF60D48|nr:CehA/McbA family metallohydrolase [Pseudoalteromonas sp. T1lg76]